MSVNAERSLRDLLNEARAARGNLSGRDLAEAAQKHGFKVTHTTINGLLGGTYKSRPKAETIRAIAWLAGVSEQEAFTAAGLRVPGPPFADELPPDVDYLSPAKRKAVIGLLRVLLNDEAGEDHGPSIGAEVTAESPGRAGQRPRASPPLPAGHPGPDPH